VSYIISILAILASVVWVSLAVPTADEQQRTRDRIGRQPGVVRMVQPAPEPVLVYDRPRGNCREMASLLANRPIPAIHSYASPPPLCM
jgi:hypothetical protein